MAQHDHMFSFVEIQQSKQQVGLKDYRLKQSKVHCVYIARTPLVFAPFLPYPSCPSLPSKPCFLVPRISLHYPAKGATIGRPRI